jgi:electron transport protein HydN
MTMTYHGDTHGQPFRMVAYKCDLCAHTETGEPACIPACPTEALSLFDPVEARAKALAKAKAAKAAKENER